MNKLWTSGHKNFYVAVLITLTILMTAVAIQFRKSEPEILLVATAAYYLLSLYISLKINSTRNEEIVVNWYLDQYGYTTKSNVESYIIPKKPEMSFSTVDIYTDNLGLIDGLCIVREKPLLFFIKESIHVYRCL